MFTGFTQDALDFLQDIRFNNNQTFYEQNKERYEKHVKAPLRLLSDEMTPVVQLIDARLDTRPGRTMSRIRRDTRFTKDKSPFRDHVWLGWRYPGESRSEGFGIEHNGTPAEWKALHTHETADILARDLAAMAPLHQLMQRMRVQADYAQALQVKEREAQQREAAKRADVPTKITVRSTEDFEF